MREHARDGLHAHLLVRHLGLWAGLVLRNNGCPESWERPGQRAALKSRLATSERSAKRDPDHANAAVAATMAERHAHKAHTDESAVIQPQQMRVCRTRRPHTACTSSPAAKVRWGKAPVGLSVLPAQPHILQCVAAEGPCQPGLGCGPASAGDTRCTCRKPSSRLVTNCHQKHTPLQCCDLSLRWVSGRHMFISQLL